MNKFDKDLYEFVTSVENFEPAFEIANKFELFKAKLIKDFWRNVFENLKPYKKDLEGWLSFQETDSLIWLYHKKYCNQDEIASIATCFYNYGSGRIMLGIYFNKEINSFKYEKVREFAAKMIKDEWRLGPKTDSFPIYKLMNENFNTYETLRKILPLEGDGLAREYAETLVNAHKELYPLIEKFGVEF